MTRQPAISPRRLRALGIVGAAVIASAGLLAPAAPAAVRSHMTVISRAVHATTVHATTGRHARPAPSRGRAASPAVVAAEVSASARAQATGKPQVVTAATTPTSITVARPNGTFQMTMNVLPVRLKVNDRWRPVSTRLRRNPGGTWSPVLVTSPVTLSGGGTGPLAVLNSAGRRLTVTWPRPLPAPHITGPTAIYDAARGVVLQVTVSRLGGISLAASAPSPAALREVRLRLGGAGLAVTTGPGRTIAATARGGRQVLFSGPAPSVLGAPAQPRRTRAVGIAPSAGTMTAAHASGGGLVLTAAPTAATTGAVTAEVSLVPDTSSLDCDNGPGVWCTNRFAFDWLSSGSCGHHYNDEQYGGDFDPANDPGGSDANGDSDHDGDFNEGNLVGEDFQNFGPGNTCGTNRTFYVMDVSSLTSDMRIQTATLNTWLSASSDATCSGNAHKWPLNLYDLGRGAQVDSNTTWSTQPNLPSSAYRTAWSEPGPPHCTSNPRNIQLSAWDPIVNAKSNNWQYWTFAFTGEEGGSYNGSACDDSNSSENCGLMRIGDENGDDSGSTEFPYVLINFDLVPSPPKIDSTDTPAGDTYPAAYDTPPPTVVSGIPSKIDFGCGTTTPFVSSTTPNLRVWLQPAASRMQGEPVVGWYQVYDVTKASFLPNFRTGGSFSDGDYTDTPVQEALQNGHDYTWQAWSEVNGPNGMPDNYGPYDSSPTATCEFVVDTTDPTVPSVTSADFPAPGSGPADKFAGQPGTFNFSSTDNAPANCSPNPCEASGVWGYAYSLNQSFFSPVYGTNTVTAGANGNATVSITPGNWGINNLYVEAIDNAGNVSQVFDYTFYAPFNPAMTTTPGDISDPTGTGHAADLLATTGTCSSGNSGLNLYDDPGITAAAWPTPTNASQLPNASPDDSSDWACFDLTHRGNEFQQGNRLDDLWAIKPSIGGQPGGGVLYLYQNNPFSPGTDPFGTGQVTGITIRPACVVGDCTDYPSTANWNSVTGIVAVGDAWAGDPVCTGSNAPCDYNDESSLIVADSNGTLWLYQDKGGATLINPTKLGSSGGGWNNMTLLAPGQLDNGQLTLWARDNDTTDTTNYGKIFAYTLSLNNGVPTINPNGTSTPVSATSGTVLPVAAPANTYPYIATPGDAGTTGGPNLYAVDTSGNIWVWPYTANDSLSTTKVKLATVAAGTITGLF